MIITREKGMRMWGGGSGSTSASGVNGGGGFSLAVTEGEGTGNAYTGFTYESGVLSLIKGEKFVTVDFFNRLFTAYDSDGNAILPNDVTSTINNLKLLVGTWTEEYLSALGKNSEGGGGGVGIELSDVWKSLKTNTDDYANQKINSAHIPDLSGTYATQTWVNQQGFLTTHQTLYTLSIYGGTTKVLDFKPNANASIYIKAGGDISLTNDTTNKYITLSYTHPTNGANTTISAASGKVLSAITVNSLGHVTSVSSKTLASADIPDISATYATASRATTLEGYFNSGGVAKVAAKLNTGTTTYSAWGQTYWSSGVPQSISGNMTSVGSITPSANGNALGTTSARFNIYGTSGNFSGNVSIGGTLGVTGATTLTGLLTANGGIVVPSAKTIKIGDCTISWDSTNSMLKFDTGIYSTGAVSALGANSSGGGGSGTFDEEAMWTALGTTSTAKVIASSHIPNLSASKITSGTLAAARIPVATASAVGGIKVGTTLAISDGVLNQKSGIATAGTYKSVTVDTYGRVTAGTNPTTLSGYGVLDDANDRYYALNGGTALTATSSSHYDLNSLTTAGSYFCSSNAMAAYFDNMPSSTDYAFRIWVSLPAGTGSYRRQRFQYYSLQTIYERYYNGSDWGGWQIVQSNLANYALASDYLPLSGGTLTGTLTISTDVDRKLIINNTDTDTKYSLISFRQNGTEYGTLGTRGTDILSWNGYGIINTNNIGSYAPSLTGTGASGTWGISVSGNATTATTLQTSRTIWGQSFDGSSNVSGSITGATTITASGKISASSFEGNFVTDGTVFYFGDSQHAIGSGTDAVLWAYGANSLLFYTNGSKRMTINSVGSVTVVGNLTAGGEVTASSDARKKNIISNTKFSVKDIASARSILYEWNDGRDKDNSKKIHGGSIAQDWLGKADSFLSQDEDGFYSINYGALALCSAITIAKEVVRHEDRITLLEKENARLKARVEELEERRIA